MPTAQNQTGPSAAEVKDFLLGLVGSVVGGLGEVASADGGGVTTTEGDSYQASTGQQDGQTIVILESREDATPKILIFGGLGVLAFLSLRR